jgi:hypothetical protein
MKKWQDLPPAFASVSSERGNGYAVWKRDKTKGLTTRLPFQPRRKSSSDPLAR